MTDDPLERLARIDDEALEGDVVPLGQVGPVENDAGESRRHSHHSKSTAETATTLP